MPCKSSIVNRQSSMGSVPLLSILAHVFEVGLALFLFQRREHPFLVAADLLLSIKTLQHELRGCDTLVGGMFSGSQKSVGLLEQSLDRPELREAFFRRGVRRHAQAPSQLEPVHDSDQVFTLAVFLEHFPYCRANQVTRHVFGPPEL